MDFSVDSLSGGGFSWQSALSLAAASKLSYRHPDIIAKVLSDEWNMALAAFFEDGHTQTFVAESNSVLVVAFRGTESLGDWLSNIDVIPEERPYGRVHRGFFEAYDSISEEIAGRVLQAATDGKTISLTGHSLGGALALIAALELPKHVHLNAIYTFGQPKSVNGEARQVIDARLGHAYFRFVNDDDIVARIPPHFVHAGQLFHFDFAGNVLDSGAEADVTGAIAGELGVDEFTKLQSDIRSIADGVMSELAESSEVMSEADAAAVVDASVEGLIPGVSDHRIDNYISHIRRHATSAVSESAAEVETLLGMRGSVRAVSRGFDAEASVDFETKGLAGAEEETLGAAARGGGGGASLADDMAMPFLVRLRASNWNAPTGLKVNSRFANFATVLARRADVDDLLNDPNVISVEASRDAGIEELDHSVLFVGGDTIHRPPINETSDSAVVCVLDTGIDILHEAFCDDAGNTRIIGIWNQRDNTGPTPHTVDASAFSQDYGTLHTAADINQLLTDFRGHGTAPPMALRDPQLHGTHVTGIAAGSGDDTMPGGMAPDAKILVVIPNMRATPGDPPSLGYSVSHMDGLVFAKSVAAGGNVLLDDALPIAMNVSLGMNAGAHDGKTSLEIAFDTVTGGGRDPGCVIVKSAGNERGHAGHAKCIGARGVSKIAWTSTTRPRTQDYFEAWFDGLDDFAFTLINPAGSRYGPVSFDDNAKSATKNGNSCTMRLTEGHHDNGDNRLTITIRPVTKPIRPGEWKLEVTGRQIRSDHAELHLWVERTRARAVHFKVEDEEMTLSVPGTANTVITVGGCNTDEHPVLNDSSSYGPTRKGGKKPELCAPGFEIVAPHANQDDHRATVARTGTSMAAPHVTGALALVLSHRHKQAGKPQYNANQLQKAIVKTLRNFCHVHNPGFGHGVLDAKALFDRLE